MNVTADDADSADLGNRSSEGSKHNGKKGGSVLREKKPHGFELSESESLCRFKEIF